MSDQKIATRAPAKLNLTFEILGRRPDGYHQVSTLMQTVDRQDEIIYEFEEAKNASQMSSVSFRNYQSIQKTPFPTGDDNLIARAIRAYGTLVPEARSIRVSVDIVKMIPIAAGMAGGSSNAASALLAINEFCGQHLTQKELLDLAAGLGSDVPFCLQGGSCKGEGRGEELTAVRRRARIFFVIAKPRFLSVSTPDLYARFDERGRPGGDGSRTAEAISALESGDLEKLNRSLSNDFEELLISMYPQLADLRERLLHYGAWSSRLTGSGPAFFALTADREHANLIVRRMMAENVNRDRSPAPYHAYGAIDCFACEAIDEGVTLITAMNRTESTI